MSSQNKKARWFKTKPTSTMSAKFDREAGTITDVVLCKVGPAKGHGVLLEQEFVNDTAKYAQENHESTGLKSRFGHPAMSDTTMGTQLGFYKNFRVQDDKVIADYQVLKAAKSSKNGDMWAWLFDMAEEKPDHVMNSIVFAPSGEYQYDDDGNRHWVWISKIGENKGFTYSSEEEWEYDNKRPVYVAMGELYFADMVEQGAATESLFSARFNKGKFAVDVNEFLNENPKIDSFIKENPDQLYTLLKQRGIKIEKTSLFKSISDFFNNSDDKELLNVEKIGRHQAETLLDAANTNIQSLTAKITQLEADAVELNTQIETLEAEIGRIKNANTWDKSHFQKKPKEVSEGKPSYHKDNF